MTRVFAPLAALLAAVAVPAAAAAAATAAAPAPGRAVPEGEALAAVIAAADAEFFELFFEGCDPARVRSVLADDVEMYHDKDGLVWRGADEAVAGYARSCAERGKPDAWRSRRELVAGSMEVWPVPGYGAMAEGHHLFHERKGAGPEKLAGKARFGMVWALGADGRWRLARILSYAHAKAD